MPRGKASTPGATSAGTRSSRRLRHSEEPNQSPLQQLATPKRNTRPRVTKAAATAAPASSRITEKQAARVTRSNISRQPTPEKTPEENREIQETNSNDNQDIDSNDIQETDPNEPQQTIEPSPPSSPLASLHEQSPPTTHQQLSPSPTIEADSESDSSNYIRKTHEEEHNIYTASSGSDSNSDASSTPAVAPLEEHSIAQVRSLSPATPAAHEVESIGVQTSPILDTEPYHGSYAERRRQREQQISARCRAISNVKIVIPRTRLIVELAHFDDPIVDFTSSDINSNSEIRTALYTLAFKLTETEKVDKLVRQRAQLLEMEESNAGKLAAKDAEIAKLKKQLKKVVRKSSDTMTPSPKGLNENGKRPAPINESNDANEQRSPRRLRVQRTPTGAIQVLDSEDPSVDNSLRRLIFNQPAPKMPTIDEDDEESQEPATQQSDLIQWSVNYAIDNAPTQTWYRQRMINFKRAERRQKRIDNGEGDYESDHECDQCYVLPAKESVPAPAPTATDADNDNDDNDNDTQIDDESEIQESVQEQDQSEDELDQQSNPDEAASEPQESSTAIVAHELPPQTPSRWGFRSLLGSVTRLVGRSPRTEPPRSHVTEPQGRQIDINTPTAQRNTSASRRRSSTPTTPPTGITSNHFIPQTAPQLRNTADNLRMKKTRSERMASYQKGQERVRKEAAAAKEAAEAAEDRRLHAAALELRQQVGQKRKRVRVDDLKEIPAGPPGTFSLIDEYFQQNSDGEDDYVEVNEDISMLDVFTPAPSPSPMKKVRFNDSPGHTPPKSRMASPSKSSMATPTRRTVIGDPHRAQPYLGTMFLSPSERAEYQGANIFNQSQSTHEKKAETTSVSMVQLETYAEYGRRTGYWTGPKAVKPSGPNSNPEGTFVVPDDSDTESEYDSENEITHRSPEKTEQEKLEQRKRDVDDFGNIFSQHQKSKMQESTALTETAGNSQREPGTTLQPPPTPTPGHASLPAGLASNIQNDSDALARARSQAEKYKPKTPSGLRAASKLASSPISPNTLSTPTAPLATKTVIDLALTNVAPVQEEFEDEFAHQWVWPAATVPNLPPLDEQSKVALAAFFASQEGIDYVDNYYKVWCPKEFWPKEAAA